MEEFKSPLGGPGGTPGSAVFRGMLPAGTAVLSFSASRASGRRQPAGARDARSSSAFSVQQAR